MPGPMGGPPGGGRRRGPGGPPPGVNISGEKTDFAALGKILRYCKRYLPAVIAAVIFAIGGSIATIIGPQWISELTNTITAGIFTGIDMAGIRQICMTLVVIYAAGAVLGYGQQFITATLTQYVSRRLRTDIDQKINRLPLRYFDTTTKGDILSRVTNDVDTISQTLSQSTANLISSAALFVGVIWKMFRSNAVLALVTVLSAFLGFGFMALILSKSQKYFIRKQNDLGVMNGQIEEVYTNHNIVRAFGAADAEKETFRETNHRLYDSDWKSHCLSGMMPPVMAFVGNLGYVLIFVIGVAFILNGNSAVTLGTIMAFIIYSKLFSQPLQTFSQSMTSIQQASAAARRVFEVLEAEELPPENGKNASIPALQGNVEFRDVRFGYSPEKEIIHGFSAKLKAGQKVAIVGPTGAGKTTLVNLLMRFYEVGSGDILIDGVSIRDMKREDVHDLFDMILQDTWLFDGTIRENLIYNQTDVTDADLDTACAAVGLRHFIATLPQGYDTPISESLNLSEGQKQQLTIARAIIKKSPLLILDEATSSVDTRTELVIQHAMDELTKGRTSFVIAHRLSTIRDADVILVLREGDIVEQGSHTELLKLGGFYAELYNSQFCLSA